MATADDKFQQNINEIFKHLSNTFGIADDILIVGYDVDGEDHNTTLKRVMQICLYEILKLNKNLNVISGIPEYCSLETTIQIQSASRPKEAAFTNRYATPK